MNKFSYFTYVILTVLLIAFPAQGEEQAPLTPSLVIEQSNASDWRTPAAENLVYMELASGLVIFELAPEFAPQHVANLQTLIKQKYFDGLAVIRSQDNYVAQWGDPFADTDQAKEIGEARAKLEGEFFRPLGGLEFSAINSRDAYADTVGFSRGFTVGHDGKRAWLTHCYGALGVGRGGAADSGNATSLYMVTGHAPRHLDRNVTLIGRALQGMEHLSSLPRGSGTLGFYEPEEAKQPIKSIRLGSQLPDGAQPDLQIMRTDTATFANYVKSRTFRKGEWFLDEAGKIGICNVGVPTRRIDAD